MLYTHDTKETYSFYSLFLYFFTSGCLPQAACLNINTERKCANYLNSNTICFAKDSYSSSW